MSTWKECVLLVLFHHGGEMTLNEITKSVIEIWPEKEKKGAKSQVCSTLSDLKTKSGFTENVGVGIWRMTTTGRKHTSELNAKRNNRIFQRRRNLMERHPQLGIPLFDQNNFHYSGYHEREEEEEEEEEEEIITSHRIKRKRKRRRRNHVMLCSHPVIVIFSLLLILFLVLLFRNSQLRRNNLKGRSLPEVPPFKDDPSAALTDTSEEERSESKKFCIKLIQKYENMKNMNSIRTNNIVMEECEEAFWFSGGDEVEVQKLVRESYLQKQGGGGGGGGGRKKKKS